MGKDCVRCFRPRHRLHLLHGHGALFSNSIHRTRHLRCKSPHSRARTHAYEHKLTQHLHAKVSYGRIAVHYLKTWFFLDFFGSVPFDKIGEFILDTGEDAESQLKPLRMIR